MYRQYLALLVATQFSCSQELDASDPPRLVDCSAPVGAPPAALGIDGHYARYLDAGLPIVGSAAVDDAAFAVACEIVTHMLAGRPDIEAALAEREVRVGIIAEGEVLTDMPEYRDLDRAFPEVDWDARARGLGATLSRPLVSCGEDNLLATDGDWYKGELILVHELAHTVWLGVTLLPDGRQKHAQLLAAYAAAMVRGTFARSYAATNPREYWAEGVQAWFDTNGQADPADGINSPINTRQELIAADPALAALIGEVFGHGDWRPTRPRLALSSR